MHSFRISKHTHLTQLKKAACDFWGVNDKDYEFYEDSGKKYSNEEGNSQAVAVSKYFETSTGKSSANKLALLYLGNKQACAGFDDNLLLYVKDLEEQQRNERMGGGAGAVKQIIKKKVLKKNAQAEEEDEEEKDDLEEKFLANFAGLREQFKVSKMIKQRDPNKGDTKCCQLFVMILLFVSFVDGRF
jgi:hypothetical protein